MKDETETLEALYHLMQEDDTDTFLRAHGYDPDAVGRRFEAVAQRAISNQRSQINVGLVVAIATIMMIAAAVLLLSLTPTGDAGVAIIEGTPVWRNLTIAEAEEVLGYDIWQPTNLPDSWNFGGAQIDYATCRVNHLYTQEPIRHFISIRQSCRPGVLMLEDGQPTDVEGNIAVYKQLPDDVLPYGGYRLTWQEAGYDFEIRYGGVAMPIDVNDRAILTETQANALTIEDLITIAASLTGDAQ